MNVRVNHDGIRESKLNHIPVLLYLTLPIHASIPNASSCKNVSFLTSVFGYIRNVRFKPNDKMVVNAVTGSVN